MDAQADEPEIPFSATMELLRRMDELDGGSARSMSLRDYFAGQVMAGMRDNGETDNRAEFAYKLADAMIEARKQKG